MSAVVVQNTTIDKVVSFVQRYRLSDDPERWPAKAFEDHGCMDEETEPRDLAAALFQMNVDAVEQRYGHGEAEKQRPLDYWYQFRSEQGEQIELIQQAVQGCLATGPELEPTNHIPVFKAAGYLFYQCSEGFVVYRPLYKALQLFCFRLGVVIVRATKAYDEAPWNL